MLIVPGKIITKNPNETQENEITDKFLNLLENQIIEEPAYWLWTHNRWKHSKDYFLNIYLKKEQK